MVRIVRKKKRMKLVCSCGNETEFDPIDEDTGKEREESENGQYTTKDITKFDFWASHDEAGFTCSKCGLSIWYFA
jgi:DNA-directed RNA polymerase subunit M/transcription elongation factor TFIIS